VTFHHAAATLGQLQTALRAPAAVAAAALMFKVSAAATAGWPSADPPGGCRARMPGRMAARCAGWLLATAQLIAGVLLTLLLLGGRQ
jgi:hypothetical protein